MAENTRSSGGWTGNQPNGAQQPIRAVRVQALPQALRLDPVSSPRADRRADVTKVYTTLPASQAGIDRAAKDPLNVTKPVNASREEAFRPGDDAGERRHRDLVASLRRKLAEQIGPDDVERYFDGQTRVHLEDGRVEVTVASGLLAKLLDTRYGGSIRRAAGETLGRSTPAEVLFRVDRQAFITVPARPAAFERSGESGRDNTQVSPSDRNASNAGQRGNARTEESNQEGPRDRAPVNESTGLQRPLRASRVVTPSVLKYTLDNYLVGKSNRVAHGAALRVAEQPGYVAPLFIHGPCGMGKTHLIQAMVQRFTYINASARVRYTTAESFTNEFVAALKGGKIEAFRRSYRKVDLLAIDDAHFLSAKEATQAELLHTLDSIIQDGARVIFASDEHPREIQKLSDRLSSRFLAGVVVRIDPPDRELRERLIRHLASRRHLQLEDAAVMILVDRTERSIGSLGGFGGSVREIEGLLNQIDAVQRLLPEFVGADGILGAVLVRRALGIGDEVTEPAARRVRKPIPGELILAETCKAVEVEVADVLGRGRHPRIVTARALVAYLCRTLTALSFPEIAGIIGRDNHSTVITAFKRFERQMADGDSSGLALPVRFSAMTVREVAAEVAKVIARAAP